MSMTKTVEPSAPTCEDIEAEANASSSAQTAQQQPSIPTMTAREDVENEAIAAAARQRGTDMIREHLNDHLIQNPNSSYVTWIATLHPENAEVSIDQRFFVPNNPWWVVYEEGKGSLTTATSIADRTTATEESSSSIIQQQHNGSSQTDHFTHGGFLDTIIGFSLQISSVFATIGLEVGAFVVYLLAVACNRICKASSNPRVTLISSLPYAISFLCLHTFRLVDYIMLTISVFLTELLAFLAWLLCSLFSCNIKVGRMWHQNTRRLSHHTRWAFRFNFEGWEPPRASLCGGREEPDENDDACGEDSAVSPTVCEGDDGEEDLVHLEDTPIAVAEVVLVDDLKV